MWVTGSHTLTHLFHELVIVLAAVDLPGSVERHGSRLVGLKAAGDEALADRGIVNAHWPPFIYSPPLVSQSPFPPHPLTPHPSLNWHGRCSSLSHWLSVCWCGHLKTVSNVGRLPHDLEHKLINNPEGNSLQWVWHSETLWHCSAEERKRRVGCSYGCPWQSLNWAPFCSSIFSLSPCLCLAWKWVSICQ